MNISLLLDANMIGKFTYLPALMEIDVADDGATAINSGISSDMFNIICKIRSKSAFNIAAKKFRDLNLPFACWIGFEDDYPECKNDLESMGFVCDEHESGMFADIEKLSREKKCDKLQILPVDDAKKLEDFIKVYQKLIPQDADPIKEFYTKAGKHILNPESSLKFFIGYLQDQPTATSALFLDENAAGVWDVTTLPQFRRKGVGTDMTLQALVHALDNFGRRIGVLTASESGESVYRKIGFQKLKDFYILNAKAL
ncbi:MAG: GNAT family N-acetyltransferase [Holosporaceae bacterium]|jgi:ribosomal protein S18 acetylase RimI-like enzyme|nr:GNAT family N-acetyltransferase [Holosporaceae bacterium]